MIHENQNLLGKKILIVGGDIDFLNSLETAFLYVGSDVSIETVAVKGLATAKNKRPDVILLESSVADMTYDKFVKGLKADSLTKNIPVILINEKSEHDEECKDTCPVIMKKDMELSKLMSAIEKVLVSSLNSSNSEMIDISELSSAPPINIVNKNLRVLVVEDDPLLRSLLSARFEKSKIPYQFCHNGDGVIETIKRFDSTIVILDIMLPGISGLDVLEEIRNDANVNKIPVIIFSNKDNGEDRDRAKKLGVDAFLVKAMTDLNDLVNLIMERVK